MNIKEINKLKLLNSIGLIDDKDVSAYSDDYQIVIEDLHVNFKRNGKLFEAVKGANLKIKSGEVLGLVGESGSGKTTLGRATLSLWDHALGRVTIDGRELPKKRIRSVSKKNIWVYKEGQMIYQDPTASLNRQSKVLDIVDEGQKNFKTIENDQKQIIEDETYNLEKTQDLLKSLKSRKSYESFKRLDTKRDYIIEATLSSTDKEVEKLSKQHARAKEVVKEIESKEYKLKIQNKELDNKIKIIKSKRNSEKIILSEETQHDKAFFKTSLENEISELKKLKEKAKKDPAKAEKAVEKRTKRFYKRILKSVNNFPKDLAKIVPASHDDDKGIAKAIDKIDAQLKNKKTKLSNAEKFYAKSISYALKVILKKKETLVSPMNTSAYDFIYSYLHQVLIDRIHFENKLLEDLELRLKEEKVKQKTNKGDKRLAKFFRSNIDYLLEYKEIIISLIKEFAEISLQIKVWLLNHDDNGIKHFYKEINKLNKASCSLRASIITWKYQEAIKYHKRLKVKEGIILKKELEGLKKELKELEKGYRDIHNPLCDLEKLIKQDLIKFKKEYSISNEQYLEQKSNIDEIKNQVKESEENIARAKSVLKTKNVAAPGSFTGKMFIKALSLFTFSFTIALLSINTIMNAGDGWIEIAKYATNTNIQLAFSIAFIASSFFSLLSAKTLWIGMFGIGREERAKLEEEKRAKNNKTYKHDVSVQRIKDTLLKVGLNEDSLNKYPSQFSGGQKQRIGIARTIITKPKFIIADEPISALDVSVQAQVINLLKDIHNEMGLTMLFIAHDLQMVHYISDKIAVIYRGNIVEYGSADKVYNSPMHPYTKSLIGAMPSIAEVGKSLAVSEYNWADHEYNEFSSVKLWEVEEDHFVYGTEQEIKDWK